jgi:hypothetical protein
MQRSRPGTGGKPKPRDIVQLDVGVSEKREIYSWPDDPSFSPLELGDLVGHGLLATGIFSGFARDLFVAGNGIVRAAGEEIIQGHRELKFTYRAPSLTNRWVIHWQGKDGLLGESGQFWVSAQDFHLLRLKVDAEDIPPQMLLRSLSIVVDYQMIGNTLVPSGGWMDAVQMNGKMYHNAVAFSHCHVFAAESKVSAADDSMKTILTAYKKHQAIMPPGVVLRVALDQAIEARNARVGDSVNARLESEVRVSQDLVIPAGSILRGRIRQFEKFDDSPNTYVVGLAFSELEWGEQRYRFFAELENMEPRAGISKEITSAPAQSSGMGFSLKRTIENSPVMQSESMVAASIPGAAVFFLTGTEAIPKGFRMTWKTRARQRLNEQAQSAAHLLFHFRLREPGESAVHLERCKAVDNGPAG